MSDASDWTEGCRLKDASDWISEASDEVSNKSGLKAGSWLFCLTTGQIEPDSKLHSS